MLDPFLHAHQIGARLYTIGGKIFPISIRDQMIRGQMFVDRAVERGVLEKTNPAHYPLLIVGGGVAGVTAALRALEHGLRVVLVEKKDEPLWVQAGCQHRWISPTLFDFPVDHWRQDQYPWPPPPPPNPPLAWTADWAHKLALAWRAALNQAAQKHLGMLTPYWESHVQLDRIVLDRMGRFLVAPVTSSDPKTGSPQTKDEKVAVVLLAMGFGDEKRYLRAPKSPKHPAWGYGFWQKDPYLDPNMKLPMGTKPEVVISGSGDGSLQDFLRIVTGGKHAREIYDRVALPRPLLLALQSAQERAQRAFNWGRGPHHDHAGLEQLHSAMEQIVGDALHQGGTTLRGELHSLI
jgi:hypothetical protein